jgi:hypothetical protein
MNEDHRLRRILAQPIPRLLISIFFGAFGFSMAIDVAIAFFDDIDSRSGIVKFMVIVLALAVATAFAIIANHVVKEIGGDDKPERF